jgi:hypothetical protein
LAAVGETDTESRTAGSTVITPVPDSVDEGSVAVIVANPVLVPAVTRPVDETDAIEASEVDQVTLLVTFFVEPSEYSPVAVSCWVSPSGRLPVGGVTVTARSAAVMTVMTDAPSIDESVAVIVAAPVPTPLTRPVDETDAVDPAEVDQVTALVRFWLVPFE